MGVISNGTTLLDAGALDSGVATGSMTLIKTLTASSSATLDFLNGSSNVVFDGTYKEYVFKFYDIHPASNNVQFSFQVDTGTNTNYNQTITSTFFDAYHEEADGDSGLTYRTAYDQAQGTAFQPISLQTGNGNDECFSGALHLFSPSSTTFVKHFMSYGNDYVYADYSSNPRNAGYVNTTTALTRIQFKFSSGNIDSGTIKMYGIK